MLRGVRTIAPEENCLPVRFTVRIKFGKQFSLGAIALEPCCGAFTKDFQNTDFIHFFDVYIVGFEQVNAGRVRKPKIATVFYLFCLNLIYFYLSKIICAYIFQNMTLYKYTNVIPNFHIDG